MDINKISNELRNALINKDICTLDEMFSQNVRINMMNLTINSKFEFIDLIQNEDLIFEDLKVISNVQFNNNNFEVWINCSISNKLVMDTDANLRVRIVKEFNQLLISHIQSSRIPIDSIGNRNWLER